MAAPALEIVITESNVQFTGTGFTPTEQFNFHAEFYDKDENKLTEVSGGNNKTKPDGSFAFVTPRFDDMGLDGGGALARVHARAWHDDAVADATA